VENLTPFLVIYHISIRVYSLLVPVIFNTGVMMPVLKNQPLTLGLLRIIDLLLYLLFSSKLFELIVYPRDISICINQFG